MKLLLGSLAFLLVLLNFASATQILYARYELQSNEQAQFLLDTTLSYANFTITVVEVVTNENQRMINFRKSLTNGTSFFQRPNDEIDDIFHSLFPETTFYNSTAGMRELYVDICNKFITKNCIYSGIPYAIVATLYDDKGKVIEDSETLYVTTRPLGLEVAATILPASTTSTSIFLQWGESPIVDPSNYVVSWSISVRFSTEGNAWELAPIQASNGTSLVNQAAVTATSLNKAVTSFTISGCYPLIDAVGTHCIAPWTTYQVVIRSVGTASDAEASIFVTTKEGRPRVADSSFASASPTSNLVAVRIVPTRPFTGSIIGYNFNYTSSVKSDSFYAPLLNVSNALAESVFINGLRDPYHVVRIQRAVPYVNYTYWFAPVTSAGPAPAYTGPLWAVTAGSTANQPPAPVLELKANATDMVVLRWSPPSPPWGLITRYQIISGYDANNVTSGSILHDTTNVTNLYLELSNSKVGNEANIRVRAFTSIGSGPWSDRAVDNRPAFANTAVIDNTSDQSWIVAAIVVPIVVVLIIVIVVLLRRPREVVHSFEFPASDQWEIKPSALEIQNPIGSGAFGQVHAGVLNGQEVAVKTMRGTTTIEEKRVFVGEAHALKRVNTPGHRNVLRLVGCVLTQLPLLVVTELLENKDLKSFLIKNREENHKGRDDGVQLTHQLLFRFASDISAGMAYLSGLSWVHRDLACRNCLVAKDLTVKISDFGFSKDVGDTNYYRHGPQDATLPIRWMAPECLLDGKFDTKGDIWSFGIVMWEIFSLGQTPYATMSNTEVLERVVMGYRLPSPTNTPDAATSMMMRCWSVNRPSFESMTKALLFWSQGGDLSYKPELETARDVAPLPSNYSVLKAADRLQLAQAFQQSQSEPDHEVLNMESKEVNEPDKAHEDPAHALSFNSMSIESEI